MGKLRLFGLTIVLSKKSPTIFKASKVSKESAATEKQNKKRRITLETQATEAHVDGLAIPRLFGKTNNKHSVTADIPNSAERKAAAGRETKQKPQGRENLAKKMQQGAMRWYHGNAQT